MKRRMVDSSIQKKESVVVLFEELPAASIWRVMVQMEWLLPHRLRFCVVWATNSRRISRLQELVVSTSSRSNSSSAHHRSIAFRPVLSSSPITLHSIVAERYAAARSRVAGGPIINGSVRLQTCPSLILALLPRALCVKWLSPLVRSRKSRARRSWWYRMQPGIHRSMERTQVLQETTRRCSTTRPLQGVSRSLVWPLRLVKSHFKWIKPQSTATRWASLATWTSIWSSRKLTCASFSCSHRRLVLILSSMFDETAKKRRNSVISPAYNSQAAVGKQWARSFHSTIRPRQPHPNKLWWDRPKSLCHRFWTSTLSSLIVFKTMILNNLL